MSPERQAAEVRAVKKHESWIISNPVTISSSDTIGKAGKIMEENNISGLPVIDGGELTGIITNRDLRFKTDRAIKVADAMTKELVTIGENAPVREAIRLLDRHKIEKLLVTDRKGKLVGLITVKDISKKKEFPDSSKDSEGRLRVAAAVGPLDMNRATLLVDAGADALVIDTAHGHSENVLKGIKAMKKAFGIDVVAGNIATEEAAEDLISAGALERLVFVDKISLSYIAFAAGSKLYLKDMKDFQKMNQIFMEIFPDDPPARTTVQTPLAEETMLVEIEAVAWTGD